MSKNQRAETGAANGQSVINRIFGVGFRRDTYKNFAYLLARFPLGIVYFTIFVTGLSLGIGLIPVIVGIPILAGVLGLAGYVGVIETELLSRLYGQKVSYNIPNPSELPITEYLKTVATSPRNYLLVLFALASFFVGLQVFITITVTFTLALVLVTAPLFYWMPGVNYEFTQTTGVVDIGPLPINADAFQGSINTLPEALVASVVGVGICLVGLHVVNLTAGVFTALTKRLIETVPE